MITFTTLAPLPTDSASALNSALMLGKAVLLAAA